MSPNAFFTTLEGQSLLIPGQAERFRGQCVQSVGLYVQSLGISFPAYQFAYLYYDNGIPGYKKVGAGNPIKEGDIIVWGKNFPASPGAGHIDVAAQDGTLANFVAWDSNWYPPLKLAKLTHIGNNNNYIAGYLRREDPVQQISLSTARILYFSVVGRDGQQGRPNAATGECDGELNTYVVGKPLTNEFLSSLWNSPESDNYRNKVVPAAFNAEANAGFTPYTGSQLFVKKG